MFQYEGNTAFEVRAALKHQEADKINSNYLHHLTEGFTIDKKSRYNQSMVLKDYG